VITSYGPTLLRTFGVSSERSALLLVPLGAIEIPVILGCGLAVQYWQSRWVVTIMTTAVGISGSAILAFDSRHTQSGKSKTCAMVATYSGVSDVESQHP
jgi:hypothetical protein